MLVQCNGNSDHQLMSAGEIELQRWPAKASNPSAARLSATVSSLWLAEFATTAGLPSTQAASSRPPGGNWKCSRDRPIFSMRKMDQMLGGAIGGKM